ncbi:hypothetical protein QBC46DRAFT_448967 [Diplogelasinospora grovesii]|uniref:2EXR domain-containing protein n=1 Tax=Diplogelasinospora grovesii TaxID=303347 RepID=A0AAN6S5S9_9PEZI|nr:hypothetical protein QBC46DRAFT_448967 [Diplogelasinospora grovesii]
MHHDHHSSHRCCPPPPSKMMPERFDRFQRLPAEIRNMIWEYSLPEARVYEVLDAPNAKQKKTPPHKGLMFANVHPEPPPALAAVCRESRYFVLHHYKPLTLGMTTKYVDLSRDILLLEPYLLVKRLHRTLHFMGQIPLVRDNITRLALGTSYGVYTGICHPILSWKVSKTNMGKLLQTLDKFSRLKTLVFIVHQEFQFEFDFRFPGTLTPIPNIPSQYSSGVPMQNSVQSRAAPLPGSLSVDSVINNQQTVGSSRNAVPLTAAATGARPSPPSSSYSWESLPSLPITPQQPYTINPLDLPRPQLVHQAYRFKFDIEANINHTPRRPHLNELLYYPLDIDEDKDDFDLNDLAEDESEWCDPWPTNDDWRRFRKRFQRAINLSLENTPVVEEAKGSKGSQGGRVWPGDRVAHTNCPTLAKDGRDGGGGGGTRKMKVPELKGASLLWRYTRGGYV